MAWVTVDHADVPQGAGTIFGADFGQVTYDDEVPLGDPLPPPPPDVVAERAHEKRDRSPGIVAEQHPGAGPQREA